MNEKSVVLDYIKNQLELYSFLKNPKSYVPCKPENIYIEPTNKCNLHCLMCSRKKMTREIGFMTIDNFEMIVDKLNEDGFNVPLTLIGMGEPLLHKDIGSMIKYAKSKNFNISIISNGTLLSPRIIEMLLDAKPDRFQTMFDSIDPTSYQYLRGGAKYDVTLDRLKSFILKNEEAGHPIHITIGSIKTPYTLLLKETEEYWKSLPIDNFYTSKLFTLQAESGLYDEAMQQKDFDKARICICPFTNMNINWKGDIAICPLDCDFRWIIGNMFTNRPKDAWNGVRAQALRTALITNNCKFFKKNNFRCDKCNLPYMKGYTTDAQLESMAIKIKTRVESYI